MQDAYADYVHVNSTDAYSARIISYAEDWANLMEAEFAAGRSIGEVAEATSRQADTDGITGFMYGAAVSGLAHFWEHGELIRVWHNLRTQIQDEGDEANDNGGVLNPAILVLVEACEGGRDGE